MTGRMIRNARARLGWSQRKLASECHVSQAAIAKLEAGTTFPGPNLLESLLKILDLAPLPEKPIPIWEPPEKPTPETQRLRREKLIVPEISPDPEDESQAPPDW